MNIAKTRAVLDMFPRSDSRKELRAAAAAGELEEFMERRSYLIDQASNMDW